MYQEVCVIRTMALQSKCCLGVSRVMRKSRTIGFSLILHLDIQKRAPAVSICYTLRLKSVSVSKYLGLLLTIKMH